MELGMTGLGRNLADIADVWRRGSVMLSTLRHESGGPQERAAVAKGVG